MIDAKQQNTKSKSAQAVTTFEGYLERYVSLVFGIAQSMTADLSTAEHVTQSVFTGLWLALEEVNPQAVGSWLSRRARSEALTYLRGQDSLPAFDPELVENGFVLIGIDDASEIASSARRNSIESAMKSLTLTERQCILIGFFEGSTCEEIATRLEVTPQLVKRAIRSGLTELRRHLVTEIAKPARPKDVFRDGQD